MKHKLNVYFLALLAFVGVWSCSPKDKENKDKGFGDATLEDDIKGVLYNIPKTSDIPYLLMATGAEFNPGVVNVRSGADSYASQSEKAALNLGVYASDIAYLSSYDKTQESMLYLNTCKDLADKLGLLSTFGTDILKQFEDNIGNKDKLAEILDKTIRDSGEYLKNGNQSNLAALLVTGSFVEGLHIGTTLVNTYPHDLPEASRANILTKLINIILDQEASVSEVIKMLSAVPQEGGVPAILEDFKKLQTIYSTMKIGEKKAQNKGDLVFTDKDIAEISTVVAKIRGGIVQNN